MSERAPKLRKPPRFSKREVTRLIEGIEGAGRNVASVRIDQDGILHAILVTGKKELDSRGRALDAADVL
jgi:hypothetical protein